MTCEVSLELQWGTQGAFRVGPGKDSLHSSWEGEHSISLESHQGNQASRQFEEGILSCFSSCSRKPWVPSTCDCDLRELFRVPMGSEEYCGIWRGPLVLHWVWCSGRGPHLVLRPEPQGSFPFLTSITGSLHSWNRRVRSRLVLRNGTPLASCVVHGVTGHLSSCF